MIVVDAFTGYPKQRRDVEGSVRKNLGDIPLRSLDDFLNLRFYKNANRVFASQFFEIFGKMALCSLFFRSHLNLFLDIPLGHA